MNNYMKSVKKMACGIVEMMVHGLKIQPMTVLSKLLMVTLFSSHDQPFNDSSNVNGKGDVVGLCFSNLL
ncbi:hypothetical protein EPI10_015014 [Gossypium australe]|uniref:Uncharacterized protein n=1 Tax=Gossypium australe TaxID=47621 RepID=A0A5B6VJF9_9ROSI|nr:hypothetical protein EPI10_015014 [Gossypium australe]